MRARRIGLYSRALSSSHLPRELIDPSYRFCIVSLLLLLPRAQNYICRFLKMGSMAFDVRRGHVRRSNEGTTGLGSVQHRIILWNSGD